MRGDYKSAYYSLEKESELQDSIIWGLVCQKVTKAVADYNKQEQQAKDEMIRLERTIFVFVVIFVVLITLTISLALKMQLAKQKINSDSIILLANNLTEKIRLQADQNMAIKDSLHELLRNRLNDINELCLTYYEYKGTVKEQKKISDKVKLQIEEFGKEGSIQELAKHINKYTDNIIDKF